MILLRQLLPLTTTRLSYVRFFNRKSVNTVNADMKQVHQETLRRISPCARVNVYSDIYVKVRAADVHQFPDGDAFIAELHGGPTKNCTASMQIQVSDDEEEVNVTLKRLQPNSDFHCELALPIKAALSIDSENGVSVRNIFGNELKIRAKFIKTKEVRADKVALYSEEDIRCFGLLLSHSATIESEKGNVLLDKLQGDQLSCKTKSGNISTNCSYVEASRFETDTGSLQLRNVHKRVEVYVHRKGNLNMTGFHGNLNVRSNGGSLHLQLSKISGENTIVADELSAATINISEAIEQDSYIEANVQHPDAVIDLDNTLAHLASALSEDKRNFCFAKEPTNYNKLLISSQTSLRLGKSSWMDSIRNSFEQEQIENK